LEKIGYATNGAEAPSRFSSLNSRARSFSLNKLPHLLFGNTSDILWILDGINSADVGVCLDTSHAFLTGDIHNLVHKLAGHFRMIHACDNGGAEDNAWPPEEGQIDWEKFMRGLIDVRFRGAFVFEMAGNDDPAVTMTNARC
jgi:sugar phosphate isomerase/epimerase